MAAALAASPDGQVLVLLPEIALTAQWLKRFEDRFGAPPAPWHSGLTGLERRETWRGIRQGTLRLLFVSPERLLTVAGGLALVMVTLTALATFRLERQAGLCVNAPWLS